MNEEQIEYPRLQEYFEWFNISKVDVSLARCYC